MISISLLLMCLPELGKTEDSTLGLLCCAGHLMPLILPMNELLTLEDRAETREDLWVGDSSPGLSSELLSGVY